MSTMETSLARFRGSVADIESKSASSGFGFSGYSGSPVFGDFMNQAADRQRYGLFRGWVYSAVNALASEAAGRPVTVARLAGEAKKPKEQKFVRRLRSGFARIKAADQDFEVLIDHEFAKVVEKPNEVQGRWQFVYSFVANLNLTGWAYVVGGKDEDGRFSLFSVPTPWVQPDHSEGPFSRFKIVDPKRPAAGSGDDWLTSENVKFAYLPNPIDPRTALSPAQAEQHSVRIDDLIQTSRARFFDNGIFPGAIVTIGKNPHPDVPGGLRPRLTQSQRRQIEATIARVMTGVTNTGRPAILDGMIESIERLSMNATEMGWEKSEDKNRNRILSAFGVHPYILGEAVSVGGYAQVANIEKRFFSRVNTFLDMLSSVCSGFAEQEEEGLLCWWEECQATDPSMRWSNLNAARARGDVTEDEIRVELGLPQKEKSEGTDQSIKRNPLLESVGGMTGAIQMMTAVGQGAMPAETAAKLFSLFFEIPESKAKQIVGKAPPKPSPATATPGQPPGTPETAPGSPQNAAEGEEGETPPTEEEAVKTAAGALELAVKSLGLDVAGAGLPKAVADKIVDVASGR